MQVHVALQLLACWVPATTVTRSGCEKLGASSANNALAAHCVSSDSMHQVTSPAAPAYQHRLLSCCCCLPQLHTWGVWPARHCVARLRLAAALHNIRLARPMLQCTYVSFTRPAEMRAAGFILCMLLSSVALKPRHCTLSQRSCFERWHVPPGSIYL